MHKPSSFIRLKEVMKRTGLSRSTIYELMDMGKFPKQVELSLRCVGWVEDEIHEWIVKRLEATRKKQQQKKS